MAEEIERKKPVGKRLIVWIMNIVIAVLCVLSILCYFFGAVWKINLTYTLTADQFAEIAEGTNFDIDPHDIIDEDGEQIKVSVSLTAGHVFGSLTSAETVVDDIIDSNVNGIVDQLSGTLNVIAKKAVKSVAKNTVKSEVKNNIQKYLSKDGEEISEEEVEQKLSDLGFTDDYISEKTDQLIDDVFEGGKDIDAVTENIMDTVDEVYADFQKNSAGKEGFEDFTDVELSPEDKQQIEDTVRETLGQIAQEDGTIDPDEMIAELLAKALGAAGNSGTNSDENKEDESGTDVVLLAEEETASSGKTKLASALKDTLNERIPEKARHIAVYVFYGMAGLMVLSMLPWVYILIKLLVKFLKKDPNPTVKLAVPIWLGWLFFLILVAIPTIALWIVQMPALAESLASVSFLKSLIEAMEMMTFSISSLSCISAICALIVFGISIYYIIVRKQLKKEGNTPAPDGNTPVEEDETPVFDE